MRWRRQIWIVAVLLLLGIGVLAQGVTGEVAFRGETTMQLPDGAEVLSNDDARALRTQVSVSDVAAGNIVAGLEVVPDGADGRVDFTYAAPSRYEVERVLRAARGAYLVLAWPDQAVAYGGYIRALARYDDIVAELAELPDIVPPSDPRRQELLQSQQEAAGMRDVALAELDVASRAAERAISGRLIIREDAVKGEDRELIGWAFGIVVGGLIALALGSRFLAGRAQRRNLAW